MLGQQSFILQSVKYCLDPTIHYIYVGGVLKLSGPADSKTDTGFEICPRFVGVIGQNKIQRTYDHDCSSGRKSSTFCFAQLLLQIFVNY